MESGTNSRSFYSSIHAMSRWRYLKQQPHSAEAEHTNYKAGLGIEGDHRRRLDSPFGLYASTFSMMRSSIEEIWKQDQ